MVGDAVRFWARQRRERRLTLTRQRSSERNYEPLPSDVAAMGAARFGVDGCPDAGHEPAAEHHQTVGATAAEDRPGLAALTDEVLFGARLRRGTSQSGDRSIGDRCAEVRAAHQRCRVRQLWRRSDLTLRIRSLITIAALAAMADDDQLDFYLRRGVESGLTQRADYRGFDPLGFYAGWAKATKAMTAVTRNESPNSDRSRRSGQARPAR
jgi:4-carboxymuconolactone decarboxylase